MKRKLELKVRLHRRRQLELKVRLHCRRHVAAVPTEAVLDLAPWVL
jgi:hypothetical protein